MTSDEETGSAELLLGQETSTSLPEETAADNTGACVMMGLDNLEDGVMNEDMDMDMDMDGSIDKPPRKMTSTSDATSVTGAMSLDDTTTDDQEDDYQSKQQVKPPLDALDEHHEGEDDCDCDSSEDTPVESRCWVWFKRILLFFVIFGVLGFSIVMIGAAIEKNHFDGAEGTTHLYQMPQVCGVEDPLTSEQGITFDSVQQAHDSGTQIAHCGDCGSCSTAHDMAIMSQTADSLTRDSTRCAFKIFIGRRAVEKCMESRIGFTPECEDCWLDNISCSFKSCKFTCIKFKLFRQDNNKGGDELNDCLRCDERMCGPGFIECSGSNRRRMGIVSDIGRDAENEQCQDTDVDWLGLFDQ